MQKHTHHNYIHPLYDTLITLALETFSPLKKQLQNVFL